MQKVHHVPGLNAMSEDLCRKFRLEFSHVGFFTEINIMQAGFNI
jgi:hypothetical protein